MECYIGLGSNLGDREANLRAGLRRLALGGLPPVALSSVWDTAPVDCPGPDRFLNMVARVELHHDPRGALELLMEVERELGRVRGGHNAPRALDLDLLIAGELERDEPGLTLPHPRMWERRFVLAPLAEIAPSLRNRRSGMTVAEQERALRGEQPDVVKRGPLALPKQRPL